ncbi:unnamed protein product [Blepharisma stoltei]|uniref:EF-hand domain-containing protein n=1 Tax=Blepharisma stoltei TaxID=1481888 RepID=A0AAU9I7P5_9CILI|nr:unnamed protein product [Blepharisma stoltei]
MSDLFELNRPQLQKIFDAHQNEGTLSFTDILKLCSSARIFPDLLTSQNLRKLAAHASKTPGSEPSSKLTFPQFEKLLKIIAQQCFHTCKGTSDQYRQILNHMKNSCFIRYKVELDVNSPEKKTSKSVNERKTPQLNIDAFSKEGGVRTNHGILFKPSSTRSSTAASFIFGESPSSKKLISKKIEKLYSIVSPRMKDIPQLKLSENYSFTSTMPKPSSRPPLTDRMKTNVQSNSSSINTSICPSPSYIKQIKVTLEKFKSDSKNVFNSIRPRKPTRKNIQELMNVCEKRREKWIKLKLSFQIWRNFADLN